MSVGCTPAQEKINFLYNYFITKQKEHHDLKNCILMINYNSIILLFNNSFYSNTYYPKYNLSKVILNTV